MDILKLRKQAELEPLAREILENELWEKIRAQIERNGMQALRAARDERETAYWQAFLDVNDEYTRYLRSSLATGEDAAKKLMHERQRKHRS